MVAGFRLLPYIKTMKLLLTTLLALCMCSAVAPLHAAGSAAPPLQWVTPSPAPALVFKDASGLEKLLETYRGTPVLLNLWATWCAPCVQEMPSLNRLQQLLGSAVKVVPLSFDAGPNTVAQMYFRLGLTDLPIYLADQQATSIKLGTTQLPMSYLLDRDGRIVAVADGALDWTAPDVLAGMQRFMALVGPPPSPSVPPPLPVRDVVF
jgi:thiol-disulfide isomerase/thioredoxin